MTSLIKVFKARRDYRCNFCGLKIWAGALYVRFSSRERIAPGKYQWKNQKACASCAKTKLQSRAEQ